MKIINFSVTNYRSITSAHKIPLTDLTVLIGKNNEGKSNLLKALNVSMKILEYHSKQLKLRYGGFYGKNNDNYYNWERDFPISNRKSRNKNTTFRIEFELEPKEVEEFRNTINSNLNGTLPIEISIGSDHLPTVKVIKNGRGAKTLNSKSKAISEYIGKKIYFNYIPAVRTDKESMQVIDNMLSKELELIESRNEYKEAVQTIYELQKPILEKLQINIKESLSEFLPHIKDVFIEQLEEKRRIALRTQYEVYVDDGNKTNLEYKGDGVKSLAALGLLKNITSQANNIFSLIAIEEPECHLHPGAIHLLKDAIYNLKTSNQVIITSHNPLFVNRDNIKNNIIIDSGKVRVTKSIKELRDLLGIKASDNLVNASCVLVVEGEEDVISLKALLPYFSEKLSKALKNNLLIIDKLGGATNLSYKLSQLSNSLCTYHVLLDNDDEGKRAYERAIDDNNLKLKDLTLTNCNGFNESEFEDLVNTTIYEQSIKDVFGVNINVSEFRGNDKWSKRMRKVFLSQSKPWTDKQKEDVKSEVAKCIVLDVENAIKLRNKNVILKLVENLELLISTI
ncbi:ATP-dependent nuclease [Chryseobacterium profundimaris]|uniref:Predicted ATP-dependent endonuclease of the OLD family, contains P-loop ATPase and TOPRIM domains n=1 Tax=Chryseobacterium profundimaris TaxID=1387275 RepID=A0ABY1P147_9FLAO|nr:AAA family ATPase [Chryseobacterium profundimaris]SMP23446.1 Predicted ATP-dependent endonuclease of the OLD family, contains P-loop ATPase and TOPRIM domains [Chryseobacterium profundimaris]